MNARESPNTYAPLLLPAVGLALSVLEPQQNKEVATIYDFSLYKMLCCLLIGNINKKTQKHFEEKKQNPR